MEIKIKARQGSRLYAVFEFILGGIFITVGIYTFEKANLFNTLLIVVSFKIFIYQMLDLWVSKTLIIKQEAIYISCWGIKFKLDKKRSFLRIEDMIVFSNISARHPTLNIYRNPTSFLGRLFKNKIKLHVVTKEGIEKDEKEALALSEKLGIRFMNVYCF